jgi:hypothetical protein
MSYHLRITIVTLALALGVTAAACSDETTTSSSSSTSGTSTTATGSGGSGAAGQGGSGQGGVGPTGCMDDPSLCAPGWVCCTGVPYPAEGQCYPECQFVSDRNIKHDIQPVDGDVVLERLAAMPVALWRYDSAPEQLHMGPMAQDFQAEFGLGDSDRHIAAVDANGVTMAAIQALYRRVSLLQSRSEARERENRELRAQLRSLRAELERRRR